MVLTYERQLLLELTETSAIEHTSLNQLNYNMSL